MLEKASTMKTFEYFPLGKELESRIVITKKQYLKLDNTLNFDKKFKEKPALENYSNSNLIYDAYQSFYKYYRFDKNFITFFSNLFQSFQNFLKI